MFWHEIRIDFESPLISIVQSDSGCRTEPRSHWNEIEFEFLSTRSSIRPHAPNLFIAITPAALPLPPCSIPTQPHLVIIAMSPQRPPLLFRYNSANAYPLDCFAFKRALTPCKARHPYNLSTADASCVWQQAASPHIIRYANKMTQCYRIDHALISMCTAPI